MTFDRQPTLTGELLELRPLRAGDFDALFAVAADPLLWEQHPDRNRYQEEVFRGVFQDALDSGGALVALERASGRLMPPRRDAQGHERVVYGVTRDEWRTRRPGNA